jgi:hypothetical protein
MQDFFCFWVKKGSRFQPWQDFMHMHPRNWPKTSTASNFALHLQFMEVHDCCHWKECCWHGRITHLQWFITVGLLPSFIFWPIARSGGVSKNQIWVPRKLASICGSLLVRYQLLYPDRSLPKWPNLRFLLSRSITESQNQMETNWIKICLRGVKTYILEWHDMYMVLSQGWQNVSASCC